MLHSKGSDKSRCNANKNKGGENNNKGKEAIKEAKGTEGETVTVRKE